MLILNPYIHDDRFTLEADLTIQASGGSSELTFEYALSDRAHAFELPPASAHWNGGEVPREMDLWTTTCFEAFLQPVGQERYYEFNFSFKPAWNAFEFVSYRNPQQLVQTADFVLQSLEWVAAHKRLVVVLRNLSPFTKFNVGLTTVLQEKNKNIHYCSIAHNGPKPDFHLADNFTLVRGV